MVTRKDTVFSRPRGRIDEFQFDAQVADVFENMIQRSVPGYNLLLDMIGVLAGKYAQAGTNCYDLGCSLGASTLKLRQNIPSDCNVIGVDNSTAMVEKCRHNLQRDHSQASVKIIEKNVQDTVIENASVVVMNFTLQFIDNGDRRAVIKCIADGMTQGGALILSEKIKFEDPARQELMTELHHEFKKYHGYSDLEIAQKRASLEKVLIPNTIDQHIDWLKTAGFSSIEPCVSCLNFVSLLAIR